LDFDSVNFITIFWVRIFLVFAFLVFLLKNTIKVERAKVNMTQQDLADLISVSRQTINSIEAAKYVPSTVLALKIARVFKTAMEEIFELEVGD
jgi:putative transcriptional regulator